jgi:adenine phosphoribosyltransferase
VTRKRYAFPARPSPTPRGVERESALEETVRGDVALRGPASELAALVRAIPDFPKPGILFRDLTPLLADPRGFHTVLHRLADEFMGVPFDAVVAIEARGFIFGAALAARLNLAFVPVRKPGKLPYQATKVSYALEYGTAELEMHVDALKPKARVLVVDDVLATGGTAEATTELVRQLGGVVHAYAFVIELEALGGRSRLEQLGGAKVSSILRYP